MHDFSAKVLSAFEEQVRLGLDSIGQTAERYAKRDTPHVTGRLRNSITFATSSKQGQANTSEGAKATAEEYKKKATPEQNTVYIGTNVDYAEKIEFREMSQDRKSVV